MLSCSNDGTVRMWSVSAQKGVGAIRAHAGGVTDISLHATGDYVLSCGRDAKWAFHDIRTTIHFL